MISDKLLTIRYVKVSSSSRKNIFDVLLLLGPFFQGLRFRLSLTLSGNIVNCQRVLPSLSRSDFFDLFGRFGAPCLLCLTIVENTSLNYVFYYLLLCFTICLLCVFNLLLCMLFNYFMFLFFVIVLFLLLFTILFLQCFYYFVFCFYNIVTKSQPHSKNSKNERG